MILVALLTGPSEPSLSSINHFLQPMVDELLGLYESVSMPTFNRPSGVSVRCALIAVCNDLPSLKKTCGFTAFNSKVPCHKCASSFSAQESRPTLRCFKDTNDTAWILRDKMSNYNQTIMEEC